MNAYSGRTLCVGAVVLYGDRVLFVRQAPGHSLEGQWSIPWGTVEPGESSADGAVREALEEAGVRTAVAGLLGIQDLPETGWLAIVFLCRPIDGHPKPDGYETNAARYFTREEIERWQEPFEPWCKWLVLRVLCDGHRVIPEELGHPFSPSRGFL